MHLPTGCHMADSEFSIIFSRIQPRCSSFTLFIISYHVTKFYFNQFLAPYSTISPHPTTTTTPNYYHHTQPLYHHIHPILLTQTLSRTMDSNNQLSSHPTLQEQELWEINFSTFHLSPKYHESQLANTLDLPNDDGLEQSSLMSSSAQLHIPYHENKKCTKVKSTFFTFDLCSYTMNEYYENENPASEPHPFYFNHPLSLSYPCLTPILTLAFEFQNTGFKCECQTRMFNPWNEDLKLPDLKMSDSHIQPMELQL